MINPLIDKTVYHETPMSIKPLLLTIPLALVLAGCQGDQTNAPSVKAVEDANAKRIEAIDNDPRLTPEQKAAMKAHIGGVTGGAAQGQGEAPKGN
jgi:hypothetical protein